MTSNTYCILQGLSVLCNQKPLVTFIKNELPQKPPAKWLEHIVHWLTSQENAPEESSLTTLQIESKNVALVALAALHSLNHLENECSSDYEEDEDRARIDLELNTIVQLQNEGEILKRIHLLLNKVLISPEDISHALSIACTHGHADNVAIILERDDLLPSSLLPSTSNSETAFYIACKKGHVAIVKMFLESKRFDLALLFQSFRSQTPILIACALGHLTIVQMFLESKRIDAALLFQQRDDGLTPFAAACHRGHVDIVQMFLESAQNGLFDTALLFQPMNDGTTPFYLACSEGHLKIVQIFLESAQKGRFDTALLFQPMNDGTTPFASACCNGYSEIVQIFLESAQRRLFDTNLLFQPTNNGSTPFALACYAGHLETVQMFLGCIQKGLFDAHLLFQPMNNGSTFFALACYAGCLKAVEMILKVEYLETALLFQPDNEGTTPFYIACSCGHADIIRAFLNSKHFAPKLLFQPDKYGRTPFAIACAQGHVDIVQMFLEDERFETALLFQPDNDSYTSFYIACMSGHTDIIRAFLNSRHFVPKLLFQPDNYGRTPFSIASTEGNVEIVQMFLEDERFEAALLFQTNNDGDTPFYMACLKNHPGIINAFFNSRHCVPKLLFQPDKNGTTPFAAACYSGFFEIVQIFLEHEPFENELYFQSRIDGATPFYMACKMGHEGIVKMFVEGRRFEQVLLFQPTITGDTPLHTALFEYHLSIATVIIDAVSIDVEWLLRANFDGIVLFDLILQNNLQGNISCDLEEIVRKIHSGQHKNPYIITDACHLLFPPASPAYAHVKNCNSTKWIFLDLLYSHLIAMMNDPKGDLFLFINICRLLFKEDNEELLYELSDLGFDLNEFRNYALTYLRQATAGHTDARTAFLLANQLTGIPLQNGLGIHEGHVLVQNAIHMQALSSNLNDIRNPYSLYQTFLERQEFLKTLTPIFEADVDTSQIISLDTLRIRGVHKAFTFGDLGNTRITYQDVEGLFNTLEHRFEQLSHEEQTTAIEYLETKPIVFPQGTNRSNFIHAFKMKLLHQDRIAQQLLRLQGAPEEEIINEVAYIDAIFKSILQESNEVSRENPFSCQEVALLEFTSRVEACATGQKDAISIYYNDHVPMDLKIQNRGNQDPVSLLIDRAVQDSMKILLESSAFIQKIVTALNIEVGSSQDSHITIYLKNCYAAAIGLQHKLTFDAGTHMVPLELIQADPQRILGWILLELSSEEIKEQMTDKIIKNYLSILCSQKKDAHLLYNELAEYIDQRKKEGDLGAPMTDFFTLDEYDTPLLTKEGAFFLMCNKGYFN